MERVQFTLFLHRISSQESCCKLCSLLWVGKEGAIVGVGGDIARPSASPAVCKGAAPVLGWWGWLVGSVGMRCLASFGALPWIRCWRDRSVCV